MQKIVTVDPFRCRMWALHDRSEAEITEDSCRAEIESFRNHGQLVPVLGRSLRGDPDHDIELIYGARRLFVARHLAVKLKVDLRDSLADREAIVAMHIENRHRVDISPYERGQSYLRWLRTGQFESQEEIARTLKISASQVSRLTKIARLPSAIINAFGTPRVIHENWGICLVDAVDDPAKRQQILRQARALAELNPRARPDEVYRKLLTTSVDAGRIRKRVRDEVVKDVRGKTIFRIRHLRTTVAILLPAESVSNERLQGIGGAICEILAEVPPPPV